MACEFPVAVKAKLMLTAIHCLLYFYLLMFRPIRHVSAPVGRQTPLSGRDRQMALPEAKFAISDCILLFISVECSSTVGYVASKNL